MNIEIQILIIVGLCFGIGLILGEIQDIKGWYWKTKEEKTNDN